MTLTQPRLISSVNRNYDHRLQDTGTHKLYYESLISSYADQLAIDSGPPLKLDRRLQVLTFNNTCIRFSDKPTTYKLLESFFSIQSITQTREEIIHYIYQPTYLALESQRHWDALCGRVNKLIGRARIFLHSQTVAEEPHLKWLTFDSHSNRWLLCTIRH